MNLRFRPALRGDFEEYFRSFFPTCRADPVVRDHVEHEWHTFIGNPTTLSMIVHDQDRPPGDRAVGFGQTVFVTDTLVKLARSRPHPYVTHLASHRLPDGSWPLMAPGPLRKANLSSGVNALVTQWNAGGGRLSDDEERQVREYVQSRYPLFYQGYQFKELLFAATGARPCEMLLNAGFELVQDYAEWASCQAPPLESHRRPYLLGLTREQARSRAGSYADWIFSFTPARFNFDARLQELLFRSLFGQSDDIIAKELGLSTHTIKSRWARVFDSVGKVMPGLLPAGRFDTRGAEKRAHLLRYIDQHLEELRPTLFYERSTCLWRLRRDREDRKS